MIWVFGAVIGVVIGLLLGDGAWLAGGVIGGVVGWMLDRRAAEDSKPKPDRVGVLEREIEVLKSSLHEMARRLAALERGERFEPRDVHVEAAAEEPPSEAPATMPSFDEIPRKEAAAPAPPSFAEPALAMHAAEGVAPQPAFEAVLREGVPGAEIRMPEFVSTAWRWLTGGNTVVRVGVVVLFFGVAFLLKYTVTHVHVPIALRLFGAAAGSVALLGFGWWLRTRRTGYALALQGGGVGILYLVIFAAFRLYQLLPPLLAFALLVCVAALSAFLAVAQDALALAVLGVSGGFLAPILASTGGGSHVALFGYYAVLNAGILGVALFKSWRLLNVVGYVFTFGIGTVWGVQFYRPEYFTTTEPFLVLFFLFYVAIPVLFARRESTRQGRYLDATLVFGVPLVGFGLQVGLVRDIEYGAAFSAVVAGAFYLVLARAVWTRAGERTRMLAEAFLALGVVFVTLAIPLAVQGRWTSAVWALEGAAIVWMGVRQGRLAARAFGIALQVLAGIAFAADSNGVSAPHALANSFYLGCLFLAVGGLFCAWYLARHAEAVTQVERALGHLLFAWGIGWWAIGGLHEIEEHVASRDAVPTWVLYCTGTCLLFGQLHKRIAWGDARFVALALLPLLATGALASLVSDPHPLARLGAIAWPLALVAHVIVLRVHEDRASRYQFWVHAAGVWLWTALATWELAWWIDRLVEGGTVWPLIACAVVPCAVLAFLPLRGLRVEWPIAAWRDAYLAAGAAPLAVFLAVWWLGVNFVSDGDPAPLPYVPFVNPLDNAQVAAALAVAMWLVEGRRLALRWIGRLPETWVQAELAASAFIFLNAVLLRTLHHWFDVPFDLDAMLSTDIVQMSFSILWTVMALVAMVYATRSGRRILWLAGAGLMAAVVAKLFLVDLSNVGTIARIVSFLAVGVLMLIVGYFSPVPPRMREST
jgi:uncharacterized membrane protein